MLDKLLAASKSIEEHPFSNIFNALKTRKHPILPVIQPQNEVFKISNEKKKKPIETYLDTVSLLYKKRDLDILINPVAAGMVF